MTRFNYRDERVKTETLYCLTDSVWNAVKSWQQADENRPHLEYEQVEQAVDDYLFAVQRADNCSDLVDKATLELLDRLDRAAAKIYL